MTKPTIKPLAPFKPLPWQVEAWRDTVSVMLLTGSAGGGKSRLAGEKLHGFCQKYPKAMALILRKTRESMTNSTCLFMEKSVISRDKNITFFPSKHRFEYANGSVLAYGGMKNEEQREQIRSIGLEGGVDIAWLEEANKFTEDDFNEVLARMRGSAASWRQIILSCNPDAPQHWIYQRLIKDGEAKVYYSSAKDNTHNPASYMDALNALTGILALRLRDGKWVQAEGVVYDNFDPAIHLVDWFEPPNDWRRIRAIDFGYSNPFCCQWWAIDNDGRMYLYREIYTTQRIVEDHAKQINQFSEEQIEATIADHDAEDRATLERYGIRTIPAVKSVSPGIQEVQARLRVAGDGKPRMFLMRGALVEADKALLERKKPTCTEDEITAYSWPKSQDGKPVKEAPIKDNDHGCDTMRYAAMYLGEGKVEIISSARSWSTNNLLNQLGIR
ncbi:MAG: PBSX family phage terminase large subunit [Planctomycetota bacterium]|jgi:phage terminase large subunit